MTTLLAATDNDCRTIPGDIRGPDTIICGQQTKPGSRYCPECHARFYYKPTLRALKSLDFTAGKPLKMGRA